jgi:hypothetical protein
MGQFGPSLSRLDATIIALARAGGGDTAAAAIAARVRELDGASDFSHCRAVGVAAALLRDPELTQAVAGLLRKPGIRGHALTDVRDALARVNDDPIETVPRTHSLRELYLARGLFQAGDTEGLGRTILEEYARDLRGPYARHARAVLQAAGTRTDTLEWA